MGDDFEPATLERYNVCPTEPIAIVAADGDARVALTVRWGLIPPWAHELGKGFQPINGKSETAADKAPFADLMARPERHCLVLADGWYEWLKAEKKGGDRIPFRYTLDDGGPFAFAGLWCRRRIKGELVLSAAILTCAANKRLRAGARPHAVRAGRPRRGGGMAGRRGRRPARPVRRRAHRRGAGQSRGQQGRGGGRRAAHGAAAVRARAAQPGHLTLRLLAGFPA